jgi:hypothetical protein
MTFKVRVHGLPTLAVLVGLASCSPASDEANSHGFAPAGAAGGIRVTVQDEAREGGAPVTIRLSQNRQQESSPPRLP